MMEESSLSSFTLLTQLVYHDNSTQQLPIFHNETPPNTTYNFKELEQKGKQEPRCLFDIKTW